MIVKSPERHNEEEEEALLPGSDSEGTSMATLSHEDQDKEPAVRLTSQRTDESTVVGQSSGYAPDSGSERGNEEQGIVYKVYKRRWFGLVQLVLLNTIESWDWLSFSAVSTTSAEFFNVSESAINWLSTAYLFVFCVATPPTIWVLNKSGPKQAIIISSIFLLAGNWIRYAGTRATSSQFGIVMFGQILIGIAQPFVLSTPTRYSDLWFTDRGRIAATAVASLANPFGGALGQLISPFWATSPNDIPHMVLYISIISTLVTIPSFFIPHSPPTPPCASAADPKIPLHHALATLTHTPSFWLILLPFSIYVGFFNAFSSLLNQILEPYAYTETQAGICGALLIVIGLLTSAITSPLTDKYKSFLLCIKSLTPLIGLCYLAFIWAPQAPSIVAAYVIASLLGACSFSLVPIALEWLVEVTHPVSPELGSSICWCGGQFLGAIFILIMDALKADDAAKPPYNMKRALVFQAVVALAVVPAPLAIGLFGMRVNNRRLDVDKRAATAREGGGGGDGTGE
ncbi:MAG: Major facilitator super domain-containing protein 7 [Pycnora praestabilis]|nr:MAG: Major facilitator super domain-containing protein 7 [Pycnora praestabilis]